MGSGEKTTRHDAMQCNDKRKNGTDLRIRHLAGSQPMSLQTPSFSLHTSSVASNVNSNDYKQTTTTVHSSAETDKKNETETHRHMNDTTTHEWRLRSIS